MNKMKKVIKWSCIVVFCGYVNIGFSQDAASDEMSDIIGAMGTVGLAEDFISLGVSVDYLVSEITILIDNVEFLNKEKDRLQKMLDYNIKSHPNIYNSGFANSWNEEIRRQTTVISVYGSSIRYLLSRVRSILSSYATKKAIRESTDPSSPGGMLIKYVGKTLKKVVSKIVSFWTMGMVDPKESTAGLKKRLSNMSTKQELSISMSNLEDEINTYKDDIRSINEDLNEYRQQATHARIEMTSIITLNNFFYVQSK